MLHAPGDPQSEADSNAGPEIGTKALMAGMTVSLLGGALWALIVALTDYEVGWLAWGIGVGIGAAMVRLTSARGYLVAAIAAGFAVLGLLTGKLLILEYVTTPATIEGLKNDDALVVSLVASELRENHTLPASLQVRVDSLATSDTLSDALWEEMVTAGKVYFDSLTDDDKAATRARTASFVMGQVPLLTKLGWQMSGYDLLWLFLAVGSPWRMLRRPEEEAAAPPEEPPLAS